jgi:hypothetical protein
MHNGTQASENPCSIATIQKSPTLGFGRVLFASLVMLNRAARYFILFLFLLSKENENGSPTHL